MANVEYLLKILLCYFAIIVYYLVNVVRQMKELYIVDLGIFLLFNILLNFYMYCLMHLCFAENFTPILSFGRIVNKLVRIEI